jgi:oligosaccharide repeat unit polymerase
MTQLVLLPTFASLIFRIKYLNQKKIAFTVFIAQFVSLSISLIILDLTIGQVVYAQLELEGELNSLNLGYGAATLFVLCVFILFKYNTFTTRIIGLSGGVLSLYFLMIAGSRGPLLYSFLILLYCIYFSNYNKNIKRFIVFIIITLVLIFIVNHTIFTDIIGAYNPVLEERLISSIENNEISGRESLYEIGLNQFLENPFFGNYFVLTSGSYVGEYPHNIILEAFITFGLFGAIPFMILLYKTFVRVNLMVKNNLDIFWIGLVFLISFFKGLSTWNLYGNTLLWLSMGIILTYKIENLKNR